MVSILSGASGMTLYTHLLLWLSIHKTQVTDVLLAVFMLAVRGIFLRREPRRVLSDMLVCALLAWFMKSILLRLSMDGELSALASLTLGYLGSEAAIRLFLRRSGMNGSRQTPYNEK